MAASALEPGRLTSTSRFRPAEYLAVVSTSIVLVPGFETFVDSFHHISDISTRLLNIGVALTEDNETLLFAFW